MLAPSRRNLPSVGILLGHLFWKKTPLLAHKSGLGWAGNKREKYGASE